jgi:hypothetical protein
MSKTIKQLFVAVCLFAGSALAACTDPGTPHAITGNFSVELYGPVDTRPGTWGHADYVVWNQPFTNVPAGCRVQITRISGDFIAWAMGAVPAGTYAGVLIGAYQSGGTGSTRAAYAADGYFMYYQGGLSQYSLRIPFNQSVVEGYLGSDNVLCWKVAEFLNTTGFPIHMEITFSQVVFRYVQ